MSSGTATSASPRSRRTKTGDAQVSSPAGAAQPIAQLMRTRNAVNQTVAFAHATQLLVAGSAQPDNQILAFRGPGGRPSASVPASIPASSQPLRHVPRLRTRDAATYRLVMRSYDRRSGRFRRPRKLRVHGAHSDVAVDARGELQIVLDGVSGLELLATRHRTRRIGKRRTLVHSRFSSFYGLQVGAGRSGRGLVVLVHGTVGRRHPRRASLASRRGGTAPRRRVEHHRSPSMSALVHETHRCGGAVLDDHVRPRRAVRPSLAGPHGVGCPFRW